MYKIERGFSLCVVSHDYARLYQMMFKYYFPKLTKISNFSKRSLTE